MTKQEKRDIDLICMGRAAVDMYSQQIGASLERASSFAKYVGGCPGNIAIGTARLGLKSLMLTRVGNEALGRFVKETLSREGVDVSYVKIDLKRLTGLVVLGVCPPDSFPLIFYRENCADMAIAAEDFSPQLFARAHALLITGTHCSTEAAYAVTKLAVDQAIAAGSKIILDIDYRPVLWHAASHNDGESRFAPANLVAERLKGLLEKSDLIVGTEEELLIAAGKEKVEDAIASIRSLSSAIIIQKRGKEGAVVHSQHLPEPLYYKPFKVNVLNVLGAGDAFMSGFLSGWLKDKPLDECAKLGNACGALVVARHGCSPEMPYQGELREFIEGYPVVPIERIHTKHKQQSRPPAGYHDPICILAFDHREHFKHLAQEHERSAKDIAGFKRLIFQAAIEIQDMRPAAKLGIIVDEQFGGGIATEAAFEGLWCAQPIEARGSYPLEFLDNREALDILWDRPREQHVKVLCTIPRELSGFQQMKSQLKKLYRACERTGHELILELIAEAPEERDPVMKAIKILYQEGIFPDWWKLPAYTDMRFWRHISNYIGKADPQCRGVLLLGFHHSISQIAELLHQLKDVNAIKGFAIGRSIWGEAAERWFAREWNDMQAVEAIKIKFKTLIKEQISVRYGQESLAIQKQF